MRERTDYEPLITIMTRPRQQIRIADIHGIETSPDPVFTSFSELPVYEVKLVGDRGKVCKFYTQSIEDRDNSVAEINWYMQARESRDVRPDRVVNPVA